jgi:hypothetical protein
MATARVELTIESDAERVWRVVREFETGPLAMAQGLVTGCRAHGDVRTVTFADGTVTRERLVTVEDEARRIVYSIIGGTIRPDHDNAAMQIVPRGATTCTLVWVHDVLPDDLAASLRTAMLDARPTIQAALRRQDVPATPIDQALAAAASTPRSGRLATTDRHRVRDARRVMPGVGSPDEDGTADSSRRSEFTKETK